MQRVIIIGAGGHAQVVADILLRAAEHGGRAVPIGYLDDNPAQHGLKLLGLLVFGAVSQCASLPHDAVIVAVGRNDLRRHLYKQLVANGEQLITAVHPSAIIAPDSTVGPGTVICAGAIINPGASIGENVILNTAASVDHHNAIGAHVHLAPGVRLGGNVRIGEGCLVGIGAIVMPQRSVGAWSVVGAGSLVHRDLPASVTVVGVPARIISEHANGEPAP